MSSRSLAIALTIVAAAFVAFAWWVYFATAGKVHIGVPISCTAGPILIALGVFGVQWLVARRGAQGLERALKHEGEGKRGAAARNPEIDRLRREFERAVSSLKSSKLGRRGNGGAALYHLPWYTIIGPPASGKTTLLRNSGLKFPHLAGMGDRVKGVGGTRNCDWWLTNDAILLDTAGRWSMEEDDQAEWFAFLDLLKRHRTQRPLNGVIAAISLAGDDETSISSVGLEHVRVLAGRMRERLDEITARLGVELPVYLLLTKCDLVSGFVDVFGSLPAAERRRVWGFTSPLLGSADESPGERFAVQYQLLCKQLDQFCVQRMGHEVRPEVVLRVYEFPAQLRTLEEKLVTFVDELFAESAFGETPAMRGAYLTSGTQEGAPADLLLEQMASSINVRPVLGEPDVEEKKSYFLRDMLTEVVFEDRDVATTSRLELRHQQLRRRLLTATLFAAAALLAALPTMSSRANLAALAQTRELTTRVGQGDTPSDTTKPARIEDVVALKSEAERYEDGLPSIFASFGMYRGDDIEGPLVRYSDAALKEWVVRPLVNRSKQVLITITEQRESVRLQRTADSSLDDASRANLTSALKLHLLLSAPKEPCAPEPLARKPWLIDELGRLWNEADPTLDKAQLAERKTLLLRYLEMAAQHPSEMLFARDVRRVELARTALAVDDKAGALMSVVLERFGKENLTLAQLVGASSLLTSAVPINGAYTLDVWSQVAREVVAGKSWQFGDESWVLGCDQESADKRRAAEQSGAFQSTYLKRYEADWASFVQGISGRLPGAVSEAETMLTELIGRPGVLGTLIERIKENTDLPPPPQPEEQAAAQELADKAIAKLAAKSATLTTAAGLVKSAPQSDPALNHLRSSFTDLTRFGVPRTDSGETALEQYRKQIEPVLQALRTYREDASKVEELGAATKTAISNTELLLNSTPGRWTGMLRSILLPPLHGVLSMTSVDRGAQLQRKWCDLVYRPLQEELGGRYPWQPDSTSQIAGADLARWFSLEGGLVASFVSSQLSNYVVQEGNRYVFGGPRVAEARSLLREELLTFLNRANDLRLAFFPNKSPTMRMPFRIRVRGAAGYSVTSFAAGGRSVRYDSGAEVWTSMEWPGEASSDGATLTVTPYEGFAPKPLTLPGEWGLFMILDEQHGHAQILERGERSLTVGWKPKGSQNWVKVDFAWDDPRSPLGALPLGRTPRGILPVSVPARITNSGSGC
jgi:type VI secretion system protein ImpL